VLGHHVPGGVVTISHNEAFVHELCNELFRVGDGRVETELIGDKLAKLQEKEALKAAKASRDSTSNA
jgi:elongation factor 3